MFLRAKSLLLALLVGANASAYDHDAQFDAASPETWPVITLILDDIGNRRAEGKRAVALPGPVVFAVLPHTPYGPELARAAHRSGKEVMLHQPFQAATNNHLLGKGAITLDQTYRDIERTLRDNLLTVPHVAGVNNHMGSLLTRHPGHMAWVMRVLKEHGSLYFVDSVTTGRSVALSTAQAYDLPGLKRDVFLDSVPTEEAVAMQFERLKQHAREHGYAVGIGHPFPHTLNVLEKELPRLSGLGYRLIGIQRMIKVQARSGPDVLAE